MSILQTYLGSAYASHPIRWVESPQAAQKTSAAAEKPVDKVADPDAEKPQSASGDVLDISADAKIAVEKEESEKTAPSGKSEKAVSGKELTAEEKKQVEELKSRDQEVRTHEAAHVAAGGQYVTGGPSYTFQTGPDGKKYAVGGEVGISASPVEGDPEKTIQKMQTVAAAALAPAEPSGQDRKVAAAARQEIAKARMESTKQQSEELKSEETEESQQSGNLAKDGKALAETEKDGNTPSKSSPFSIAVSSASASAYKSHSSVSVPSMALSSPKFTVFA